MIKAIIYADGLRNAPTTYDTLITPVGVSYKLDESLDNASVTLGFIKRKEPLKPFTFVRLADDLSATEDEYWCVQSDEVTEYPAIGRYTHKLLLVEATKYLERFMVGTKTVTQPLVTDWTKYGTQPAYLSGSSSSYANPYVTPLANDDKATLSIKSGRDIFFGGGSPTVTVKSVTISIIDANTKDVLWSESGTDTSTFSVNLHDYLGDEDVTQIQISYRMTIEGMDGSDVTASATYTIVVYNPSKSADIMLKEVAQDLLTVCEPYVDGGRDGGRALDKPRFTLDETNALVYELSGIKSPEYTFTDSTLYEALASIGAEVHAIPRLKVSVFANQPTFKILFTPFNKGVAADLDGIYTVNGETASRDIEQYTSGLDSNAEGLVPAYGTLGAPAPNVPKTMRAEDGEYRVTEATGIISTDYPIEQIKSVSVSYDDSTYYDITPYIYEQSEYAALSSYETVYPWSKQYALYYVQGERNIRGLSFERENLLSQVFEDPAIIAIYKAASGDKISTIWNPANQLKLKFKVSYVPLASVKIRQRKDKIEDNTDATLLAYNQGANKIDSSAYGKHLAGTISRLGVPQYTRLYTCRRDIALRKASNLVGCSLADGKVITAVTVEYFPEYAKLMLTYTTDFNRINQYVGIRSQIRQYEISEKLAQDRQIVIEDYVVIREGNWDTTARESTSLLTSRFFDSLSSALYGNESDKIDVAFLQGMTNGGKKLARVALPVVSFGAGRSIVHNAQYLDNYGAGYGSYTSKGYSTDSDNYMIQENIRYTDGLGRVDKLIIDFCRASRNPLALDGSTSRFPKLNEDDSTRELDSDISTGTDRAIPIRKDNREKLSITHQTHFVGEGVHISPNIGDTLYRANLGVYLATLYEEIHTPYATSVSSGYSALDMRTVYSTLTDVEGLKLSPIAPYFNTSGKAWALITQGGKLLLWKNENIVGGVTPLPTISFSGYHKIDNN